MLAAALLVAVLQPGTLSAASASPRLTQSFNHGWRWGPVNKPVPKPPTPSKGCDGQYAFADNDGHQCGGLAHKTEGDASADACKAVCCKDNGCGDWQWMNSRSSGGGCWVGVCHSMQTNKNWTGGHRAPPIQPPPPPGPVPANPPQAQPGFDDSSWEVVSAPHDALISQAPNRDLCANGCSGRSYLPRFDSFYRKHFLLPSAWKGKAVWLTFDGVFNQAQVWLNGENITQHLSGYTSFSIRLDAVGGLRYGTDNEADTNVIAIYADSETGRSGWWYEGGGIYRHVRLTATSHVHVAPDGIGTYSNISSSGTALHARAQVDNTGADDAAAQIRFSLLDVSSHRVLGQASVFAGVIKAGSSADVVATLQNLTVDAWTIQSPSLYTLRTEVMLGGQQAVDAVDTSVGFRSLRFEANEGMFMNDQHVKVRGFCDHNSMASVGMAVPDRLKLFRAQASRSVGGNGRRTSHNAPDPVMLDIYDRVGITVMGENRKLGNSSEYEANMRDMVRRDRNHPSIHVWSFCNEAGCEGSAENGGPRFYKATYEEDGSRPTLANMFTYGDLLSHTIDVQGFSHRPRSQFVAAHKAMPTKPLYASECCSCNTMRGEDMPSSAGLQQSFNGDCQAGQTNATDGIDYAIGTMVWTLFDYYGEPSNGGWPYVSSTFGAFDLAGFPKGGAHWFRSQWLYGVDDADAGKTFTTGGDEMVYIVESWKAAGPANRSIHVYASTPSVNLLVNGVPQTAQQVGLARIGAYPSFAAFNNVPFAAGNITAIAIDARGRTVAAHTRSTAQAAAALVLSIDAPSAATGTGTALLLDGSDAGLLRATIVDSAGRTVEDAAHNVSFRVVSGPGRVVGVHSGNPASHEHNQMPFHTAYHGLVRAVIAVTTDIATQRETRNRMVAMEPDNHVVQYGATGDEEARIAAQGIVVEASAPGLASQQVTIKTSANATRDSVLAVAERSAGAPVTGFRE